jgi:hypothetical protein
MSAQDDDFFGLKSATNLPNISHPQNVLKTKDVQRDIFEENFFPEIAGREAELEALDGHAVEDGGNFFEENFTRFARKNNNQNEIINRSAHIEGKDLTKVFHFFFKFSSTLFLADHGHEYRIYKSYSGSGTNCFQG